ncbi:alpha-D-ribose 1-methylphosphonate 5-triphosphate diphosphatase [Sandarakinorhabdus sp. AAP62]|uniref:alpha-D-ribose 1-methylphosphonate 5-triphosphate diphosphatase n=1 Tax=Sandarakinorhabdus sp. AAP62 TaxID=1248916 RepID=UPI0002D36D5C|nr:alpha-D-ribose 1-methylphosphonate 5-triphosphate diphosphatase [Sandarakinorhabdus sp. AAP62]
MTTTLFSRQIVTPDAVVCGHVRIDGAHIAAVTPAAAPQADAIDLGDDLLIAGLVDIHTDNLEKHYQPRPGALWDALGAALAHDGQCITAGITTVFDSLSLHGAKDGLNRKDALGPMIAAMDAAGDEGLLRAEHLLHLRCEVTNPELLALMEPHLDNPRLKLLSLMDHTPGQRQTANKDRFRQELERSGVSGEEMATILATRTAWRDQAAAPKNRAGVVAHAREFGIALMSHDDENEVHVEESHDDGCVAAEFPVSLAAARRARELGLLNVMGGPNFVRGGSHSGNLSARDCAAAGLLDILSSDYVPLSMLRAAFQLTEAPFGWSLSEALATVTVNPARIAGLTDRGLIAPGRRADLVQVHRAGGGWPVPRSVWVKGRRVA